MGDGKGKNKGERGKQELHSSSRTKEAPQNSTELYCDPDGQMDRMCGGWCSCRGGGGVPEASQGKTPWVREDRDLLKLKGV